MNKSLVLSLSDAEWQDLYCILLDPDQAAALVFLERHFKDKMHQVLEGG